MAVRERHIQLRKMAGNMRENCGKLRLQHGKIAVLQLNLPQPQEATPLHRGHTGHQQQREGDEPKSNRESIAGNCENLRNCENLQTIADLDPHPLCSETERGRRAACPPDVALGDTGHSWFLLSLIRDTAGSY